MDVLFFQQRYLRLKHQLATTEAKALYSLIQTQGEKFLDSEKYQEFLDQIAFWSDDPDLVGINAITFSSEFFTAENFEDFERCNIWIWGDWQWNWTTAGKIFLSGTESIILRTRCWMQIKDMIFAESKSDPESIARNDSFDSTDTHSTAATNSDMESQKDATVIVKQAVRVIVINLRKMLTAEDETTCDGFKVVRIAELLAWCIRELSENLAELSEIGANTFFYTDILKMTQEICYALLANEELAGREGEACKSIAKWFNEVTNAGEAAKRSLELHNVIELINKDEPSLVLKPPSNKMDNFLKALEILNKEIGS